MSIIWKDVLVAIGSIIFIDLVLSGDNALVIGAAVSTIPGKQRRSALIFGGGAAIILRVICTVFAAFLLEVPFLRFFGGLLVLFIATRLIMEQKAETTTDAKQLAEASEKNELPIWGMVILQKIRALFASKTSDEKNRFFNAIVTIVIADITMSLDNIISVAALAKGNILFLSIGLAVSIVLLILGSAVVATIMQRFPVLIFLAYLILTWVSINLIWDDLANISFINNQTFYLILLYVLTFGVMIGIACFLWLGRRSVNLAARARR
jgi:YjbE family integral membrane protein